jgi:MFS family permease
MASAIMRFFHACHSCRDAQLNPIYPIVLMVVLNHVSFGGSRILVSLYALELSATPLVIGTLVSLYALVPLFLSVYSGRLSDRLGHRVPMLAGSVALATGLALPFFLHGMPALYASAALVGGGFSFFNIAAQALVGAISKPESRASSFSMLAMGYSVASLAGPLLVGFSVEYAGHARSYLYLALIVLPTVALLAWSGRRYSGTAQAHDGAPRRVVDLIRNRPLLWMFIASGTCVTGWDLFSFYTPIYGKSIGLAPSVIGMIVSVFGAATLVVRTFIPMLTRRFREEQVLAAALCVGAAAFAVFPFCQSVALLMLIAFIAGLGLGCGQPLTMLMTYARSPAGRAGEANGLRQMANNITHLVVPLLFGAVGSAFGMLPVFLTNTAFLFTGAYFSRKR